MQKLFIVEKRDSFTLKDGIYLRNLYQPLIGIHATMLYQMFLDYYYLNKVYKTYFNFKNLTLTLNITFHELQLAKQKLEAVGLIRTFLKNDKKHFLILLNRPLNVQKFIRNSLLYKSLINTVGEEVFEQITFALRKDAIDKNEFNEISAKFQDIFSVNKINNQTQVTRELIFPKVNSQDEALKNLTSNQFVYYLTKSLPSPSLLKVINEIQQLGFVSYAINLIIEYSYEVNGKIVQNHIKKISRNLYSKELFGFESIKKDLSNAKKNKMRHKSENAIQQIETSSNVSSSNSAENWQFFLNSLGEN